MADRRTRETLDALADLFLTTTNLTPSPALQCDDRDAVIRSDVHSEPMAHDGQADPARFPPKLPHGVDASSSATTSVTEVAAPTVSSGGLSGEPRASAGEAPSEPARRSAPAMHVEAVMLGNLPVLGRPWLTQYANHLAVEHHQPVAVIHFDPEQIELELITATNQPLQQIPIVHETGTPSQRLIRQLQDLVELQPTPIRTWLLHVCEPDRPAQLAKMLPMRCWTLLSGADEAASAAAYQTLKAMLEADGFYSQRQVGLAVMGADEEASLAVGARINETVGRILETPVRLICSLKQMVPLRQHVLARFTDSEALWPHLLGFFEALEADLVRADEPVRRRVSAIGTGPTDATQVDSGQPLQDQPRRVVAGEPGGVDAAVPGAPDMLGLIRAALGGAIALEARCPRQPHILLVLDQDGRLHLLQHHRDGVTADLPTVLTDLIEVRAWASDHAALLQLSQRQCRFDSGVEPVLHLFTDQAKLAAELVGRIGQYVKMHLLQHVFVGNQTTWCCADLN